MRNTLLTSFIRAYARLLAFYKEWHKRVKTRVHGVQQTRFIVSIALLFNRGRPIMSIVPDYPYLETHADEPQSLLEQLCRQPSVAAQSLGHYCNGRLGKRNF